MALPAIDPADAHRPHRWQCPVIMKTAPGFIAYTCSQCGAIGVVGGHEPLSQLRVWLRRRMTAADATRVHPAPGAIAPR